MKKLENCDIFYEYIEGKPDKDGKVKTTELRITGNGDMPDFLREGNSFEPPYRGYHNVSPLRGDWHPGYLIVDIAEGITSIGAGAFERSIIGKLTIPSSVKVIDCLAFGEINNNCLTCATIISKNKMSDMVVNSKAFYKANYIFEVNGETEKHINVATNYALL